MAAALWLTGCATVQDDGVPAAKGERIDFTAGPCFGVCPSYSVSVTPEGSGLLKPERFTAVPGPTRFTITPAQYRRLRDTLSSYRPATGTSKRIAHGENCDSFATDMPGYKMIWSREGADRTELDFQSGCFDARYAGLRAAVASVPGLLGIENMLKPTPR